MPSPTETARLIERDRLEPNGTGLWPGMYRYFDDFFAAGYSANATETAKFSETADRGEWLVTVADSGIDNGETIKVSDDEPGGVLALTSNDADNDGLSLQLNGEAFKVQSGKRMFFEVRMKVDDVDKVDWFFGLATTDTTGTTPILAGVTESIGFRCPDATGDIDYVVEDASTETSADSGQDLSDDTYVRLRFEVDGNSSVDFFVDGNFIARETTNLPDGDAITPTMEFRNAEAAAHTVEVDYLLVAADR